MWYRRWSLFFLHSIPLFRLTPFPFLGRGFCVRITKFVARNVTVPPTSVCKLVLAFLDFFVIWYVVLLYARKISNKFLIRSVSMPLIILYFLRQFDRYKLVMPMINHIFRKSSKIHLFTKKKIILYLLSRPFKYLKHDCL